MYGLEEKGKPATKCYATRGLLPPFINAAEPPTSKKPFSAILSSTFNHTVELLLPEEVYRIIADDTLKHVPEIQYSKVILPLAALLEKEFLATYIKPESALMVSEGRAGVDNTYTLSNGVLRLRLNKPTYERTGLVGQPDGSVLMKRSKARWLVTIDLRSKAMQYGKKGFERVVWACKNVLSAPLSWLFYDSNFTTPSPTPLDKHHPLPRSAARKDITTPPLKIPQLLPLVEASSRDDLDDHASVVYEWLSLVSLGSPRIEVADSIDPYLSRYEVSDAEEVESKRLVRVVWHGLLPTQWITQLWVACLNRTRKLERSAWFTLNVQGFSHGFLDGENGYVVMKTPRSPLTDAEYIAAIREEGEGPSKKERSAQVDEYFLWEVGSS